MNSRRYNSHPMRLLVGGYVVYLGGKILSNLCAFPPALTACALALILLGLPQRLQHRIPGHARLLEGQAGRR